MQVAQNATSTKEGQLHQTAQDYEDSMGTIGKWFTQAKNWFLNTGPARTTADILADWNVSLANAANLVVIGTGFSKVLKYIPKIGSFLLGLPLKLATMFEGLPILGNLVNPLLNIGAKLESFVSFMTSGNVFSTIITKITSLFSGGLGGLSGLGSTLSNIAKVLAKPLALLGPALDLISAIFDDGNKSIGDILKGFVANFFGGDKEGGFFNAITNALKGFGCDDWSYI